MLTIIRRPFLAILSIHNSAALFALMFSCSVSADNTAPKQLEKMVITAHLAATPKSQIGSAVTVITAKDIEQQQITYVSDILRTIPGLAVSQSGGNFGAFTQVRIRGSEGNHTLVRLNGIELNDPSGGSEFNFGNLLAENIERIEVIRGAQSALYGSDAIGGVINIITKKGQQGIQLNAQIEGGAFDTYKASGGLRGGWEDKIDFAVNATQFESEGISISESGSENDANRNLTLDGTVNFHPLKNWEIGVVGKLVRSNTETDGFQGGIGSVDADNETETRQKFGRVFSKLTLFEESDWLKWDHIISANYSDNKRDNFRNKSLSSEFDGQNSKYTYQTHLFIDTSQIAQSQHTLTFLVEHEKDAVKVKSSFSDVDRSIQTTSYVGEYQLGLFDRLFISGGIRLDENDNLFDDTTTYRATLSYLHKETDTRLHASYGTGVKNPTLFELFGFSANFQGNPDLQAEESQSFDAGIEQQFLDGRVSLDTTYYNNRIENLITGSGQTSDNQNGRTHISGIEVAMRANLLDNLDFTGSYTWNSNKDANGVSLVRRAKHIASANLNYGFNAFGNKGNFNVGVKYNGKQTDFAFDPFFNRSIVELDDYTLLNVAASYQIYDQIELFARVENLLDEHYQEIYTFEAQGIAGYAGVRMTLGSFLK